MPLTPFHWSIGILAFLLPALFYLPALAVSAVIMDLEPAYRVFISPPADGSLHGFFHTYAGATLLAILVTIGLLHFRPSVDHMAKRLGFIQPDVPTAWVWISSFVGAYSHVFLDSFLHADMRPFWPFSGNPFLGMVEPSVVYTLAMLGLLAALGLYALRLRSGRTRIQSVHSHG